MRQQELCLVSMSCQVRTTQKTTTTNSSNERDFVFPNSGGTSRIFWFVSYPRKWTDFVTVTEELGPLSVFSVSNWSSPSARGERPQTVGLSLRFGGGEVALANITVLRVRQCSPAFNRKSRRVCISFD